MPSDYIKKKSEYSSQSKITEEIEIEKFWKKAQDLMIGYFSPKEPPKFKKVSAKEDKRNKRMIKILREKILSSL